MSWLIVLLTITAMYFKWSTDKTSLTFASHTIHKTRQSVNSLVMVWAYRTLQLHTIEVLLQQTVTKYDKNK